MICKVVVTLEYKGKKYVVDDNFDYGPSEWHDDPRGQALYMWEEGNYSCDCNRSIFIGRYCDQTFPKFPCGEEINLVNIEAKP